MIRRIQTGAVFCSERKGRATAYRTTGKTVSVIPVHYCPTAKDLVLSGMGYSYADTVLAYGVSQGMLNLLRLACRDAGAQLSLAEDLTDLVAIPAFLIVADLSCEEYSDVEEAIGSMAVIHDDKQTLMFLGMPSVAIPDELIPALLPIPEPLDERSLVQLIEQLRENLDVN
jgi:hypothetical protein